MGCRDIHFTYFCFHVYHIFIYYTYVISAYIDQVVVVGFCVRVCADETFALQQVWRQIVIIDSECLAPIVVE